MKVLIVEDSPEVAEAIEICVRMRWREAAISTTSSGASGIKRVASGTCDIVLLDLNLPDMDGFEVLKHVRALSNVPVIILSVRGQEADQAHGLEIGADDYIVKPFRSRDLLARIAAVLRRASLAESAHEQPWIARGRLMLYLANNEVHLGNHTTRLTRTECRLLYMLMKNSGNTLESRAIMQEVWGKNSRENELIRTYIRRLRSRLKDDPPQIILTDHGEGYRFVSPD